MIEGWDGDKAFSVSLPLERDAEAIFTRGFGGRKATPDPLFLEYPALDKSTNSTPYSLPGKGSPQEGCGEPVPYHCNGCGKPFWHESSCLNRTCPNCYQKWASAEGRLASGRLWMGREITRRGRGRGRILHVVVSMPSCDLEVAREICRRILKRHGIEGGSIVPHPFRQDDDGDFVPDGYLHFHGFGVAFGNVEPGGSPSDGSVVFKVIKDARRKDYAGFRSQKDLRLAIRYVLTHAGILEGRHALTWYGTLSYNKLTNEALKDACPEGYDAMITRLEPRCPSCGSRDTEPCWRLDLCGYGFGSSRALAPVPNLCHPEPTEPPSRGLK